MPTQPRTTAQRLTVLGVLLAACAASADTVALSGIVASSATVVSTPTAGATALNLAGATEKIVKVADVLLSTNNTTGLTVTITSGNLTNGTPSANIAYKVTTAGDAATAPLTAAFTTNSGDGYTYSTAGDTEPTSVERDLYIAYTPAALQDPGTYTGTITLTVADNS
ncbi:MAG TPA: hypothetical protein VEY30_04810 [Myxococcaceae bacterium]|nr:hypothetical protein [Myxococcaceae bacterium]